MLRSTRVRETLFAIAALFFTGLAALALITPHDMATPLGYKLDNVNALNEFRAIYLGLWLATAAVFVLAIRRRDLPIIGDIAGLLVLGQLFGRLVSLLLDGLPNIDLLPVFLVEGVGGAAILLVRPSSPRDPTATQETAQITHDR